MPHPTFYNAVWDLLNTKTSVLTHASTCLCVCLFHVPGSLFQNGQPWLASHKAWQRGTDSSLYFTERVHEEDPERVPSINKIRPAKQTFAAPPTCISLGDICSSSGTRQEKRIGMSLVLLSISSLVYLGSSTKGSN